MVFIQYIQIILVNKHKKKYKLLITSNLYYQLLINLILKHSLQNVFYNPQRIENILNSLLKGY